MSFVNALRMPAECIILALLLLPQAASRLQFSSRYQGKTVKGLVGSSVNFTWSFSGDVRAVYWGIKRAGINVLDINGKLAALDLSGPLPIHVPSAYIGRVNASGGLSSGQAIFTLRSITKGDTNFYCCELTSSGVIPMTQFDYVHLVVEEVPTITYPTVGSSSYTEGSPVNISCNATGQPDPDVKWVHKEQVKSSGRKTAHLILSSISKADAGMYICRANNSAGSTEKQLKLEVKSSQLQFTTPYLGTTVTGLVGSSVNFTWSFSGDVRRVKWGLKDAQINDIKTNGKLISLDKTGKLLSIPVPPEYTGRVNGSLSSNSFSGQAIFILRNVTKDDERFYGCVLSPNQPFDSPEFDAVYLLVKEAPTIIHPTASNTSYNMGGSVNISCTATGKPDPDVQWTYNEKVMGSGPKTAYLTFHGISKEEAGMYICRANNSAGTEEKQLNLVVKYQLQ